MSMLSNSSLDQLEDREYKAQQETLKREDKLLWKTVGIAVLLVLYWALDLILGRGWGRLELTGALVVLFVAPLAIRWSDKRDKVQEIRDRRAIRIEAKLDRLWEQTKLDR